MHEQQLKAEVTAGKHAASRKIAEGENPFRKIFDTASEAIIVINNEGKITMINQSGEQLFGYDEDELIDEPIENLIPDKFKSIYRNHRKTYLQKLDFHQMGRHKDGSKFPVEIHLSYFILDEQMFISAFITSGDASGKAEENSRRSEERYRMLLESKNDSVIILDHDWKFIAVNEAAVQFTQLPKEKVVGFNVLRLFPGIKNTRMYDVLKDTLKKGRAGFCVDEYDHEGNRKAYYEMRTYPIPEGVIGIITDITEKKKLERKLNSALVEGEQIERKRIAKELHDSLAMILSTAKINLEIIAPELKILDAKSKKHFYNTLSLLNETLQEIRLITTKLSPNTLEDFGLVPALKSLCKTTAQSHNLEIKFYSKGIDKRLPSQIEFVFYRIAEELIFNVVKFAEADQVTVQIYKKENKIKLIVTDNGKGFDQTKMFDYAGRGFKNIESRMKHLNGKFEVKSSRKMGTKASVESPLEQDKL